MTKATAMMLQIERHQGKGKGKVKGHEGNCLSDFPQIRALLYSLGIADVAVRKCHQ